VKLLYKNGTILLESSRNEVNNGGGVWKSNPEPYFTNACFIA
jgi:hypothetical protein